MSVLAQYYNTNDDDFEKQYGIEEVAQTFTASQNYTIISIKILIYRVGTPGTCSISLYNTDESGHPSTFIRSSGFNGNNLTTDTAGEWKEVIPGGGQAIVGGTKYAIRVSGGDDLNNYVGWRKDSAGATFIGGNREHSTDNGVNWTAYADEDLMFEVWADSIFTPPSDKVIIRRLVAAANDKIWYEDI